MPLDQMPEHEFEAAPGLPEALPHGERMLWQGAPDWRLLAREVMHVRWVAGYFALMLLWRGITVFADGQAGSAANAANAALAVLALLPLVAIALGLLVLLAWLVSRTTVYTLTDRRVVLRIGIVLSITFNLPHSKIDAAALRCRADGSGDLSLQLGGSDRIAYVHLWPHARPWQIKRTQPTLRALRDARAVGALLSTALADTTAPAVAAEPVWPPRPQRLQPAASTRDAAPGSSRQQPLAA